MRIADNSAVDIVKGALPDHLRTNAQVVEDSRGLLVHVPYGDNAQEFAPVWAGEGYPRDVEAAVAMHAQTRSSATGHLVVVARRLSQGAKAWLDGERISWADATGEAHIEAPPSFFILRTREKSRPMTKPQEFRWSSSSGAIAEFLLADATRRNRDNITDQSTTGAHQIPRTSQLAHVVAWSAPQVSKSLQSFDSQGWTNKVGPERGIGAGRELVAPGSMLTSWGEWYSKRVAKHTGAHALWREPQAFVQGQLRETLRPGTWAISGWYALALAAPFTTDVPNLTCYLAADVYDDQLFDLLSALGLRPVPSGARVTFVRSEPQVLAQCEENEGIPIVSPIRLYGDLMKAGPRGYDAADHLRESEIGF